MAETLYNYLHGQRNNKPLTSPTQHGAVLFF
jgi:hypothetical protein